jgi:hypothetical protein
MKYFFLIISLLVLIYNSLLLYVDMHIDEKDHSNVYNNPKITWSSRGIYDSYAGQNSITSIKKAFDAGYLGAEVDCYYDISLGKFIVSHDRTEKEQTGQYQYLLKDGEILTLEKLFSVLGEGHYFWIDYKNLDRLSSTDTLKSIERLNKITSIHNIKERIYLEGSTPNHLQYYADAGYKTLFAFGPLRNNHIFSSISSNFYKIAYYFYDMSAVAIHYGSIDNPKYGKDTQRNLKGIPAFVFHVPNNTTLLKKLAKNKDVRVLLVGRNISVDRTDIIRETITKNP